MKVLPKEKNRAGVEYLTPKDKNLENAKKKLSRYVIKFCTITVSFRFFFLRTCENNLSEIIIIILSNYHYAVVVQ